MILVLSQCVLLVTVGDLKSIASKKNIHVKRILRIGAVVEAVEEPGAKEHGFGFATSELGHPVVSFFSSKETQPFLAQPRFTKALPIDIAPEDLTDPKTGKPGGVSVVARFTGGQVAIAERRAGRGSVLLFASTADKDWTDLPLRPAFLMLARRAVQHVSFGYRPPKTIQVNDPIVELVGVREAGAQVQVRDPRGGVRSVAAVTTPAGDLAKVEYGETRFAGFYQISRGDAAAKPAFYAANPPRTESALEAIDEAALRTRFPKLDFLWLDGHVDIAKTIEQKRVGREIWPLLFALACLCLIAESVLALRWAPKTG